VREGVAEEVKGFEVVAKAEVEEADRRQDLGVLRGEATGGSAWGGGGMGGGGGVRKSLQEDLDGLLVVFEDCVQVAELNVRRVVLVVHVCLGERVNRLFA
jgi:hypothetical protein